MRHGIRLHRWLAEQALGKSLPRGVVVHHHNGLRVGGTLVICQDPAYHVLLHTRTKIVRAGGNPNTDGWCYACKQPRLRTFFTKGHLICRLCATIKNKARWIAIKQRRRDS